MRLTLFCAHSSCPFSPSALSLRPLLVIRSSPSAASQFEATEGEEYTFSLAKPGFKEAEMAGKELKAEDCQPESSARNQGAVDKFCTLFAPYTFGPPSPESPPPSAMPDQVPCVLLL